ncbi:MAG: VOC family protein [Methylovirgula sp.]|jgi:catechol 2,3-dioxygenase-like lactoylglutathione lyase family enzyme
MLDHVGIRTKKFAALAKFYQKALAPLGYEKLVEFDEAAGFGRDQKPALWIGTSDEARSSIHLAFASPTRAAVQAFYEAALASGGRDNGKPGLRPDYHPHYYAAFVIDPDGNNIEAVCHAA